MTGLKPEYLKLRYAQMILGDEFPEYIAYQQNKIYNILEDIYSVGTVAEIQTAIDNIGTGAGTIFIESGTYSIDTSIDIDGGGSYVIYGHGDNTVLQASAGTTIFNITNCQSCLIKNLKLDINNYNLLAPNTQAIVVNEANNNVIGFSDVTIDGDGTNGIGIELQSNNCYIDQCNITDCKKGIYINNSNRHILTNNTITGHDDYGIHATTSNYLNMSTNTCNTNSDYGIYLDTITYSTVSGNICNNNNSGVYFSSCSNNTISSNSCSSNSENGIYITGSSYNTLSSNTCENNDSNSINNTAGIYIISNSDYNTISANSSNNNNNIGAGTGYGIFIATSNCNENVISSNNCNGNDIDYEDEGTGTTITYYVQSADELQDAIDSIGASTGTIVLTSGNISITTTIDIDGGGSYILKGQGENTTLVMNGDTTVFNISSCLSCKLESFSISCDISDWIAGTVIEVNNDNVIIEQISITGDGTERDGIGINIQSGISNVIVRECKISWMWYGIRVYGNNCLIVDNNIGYIAFGIYVDGRGNIISRNECYEASPPVEGNYYGIYIYASAATSINNSIEGNVCHNCDSSGIYIESNSNIITGNIIYDCGSYGIHTHSCSKLNIIGNHAYNCNKTGFIINSTYCLIMGNTSYDNGGGYLNFGGFQVGSVTYNLFIGNIAYNNTPYGFYFSTYSSNNKIVGNLSYNNPSGDSYNVPDNILFGDDTAYGADWNGNLGTPTKNAVYDKIQSLVGSGWSGWFDDGVNFRVTVVDGIITAVDNSTAGGHNP